ncbi:MAG: Dabb family protein [Bacteroidia bacterium]|nr:Dabb family protein [Bacteroidia bacterium]
MKNWMYILPAALMLACQPPAQAPSATTSTPESVQTTQSPVFIHTVFFWMKDNLSETERQAFLEGVHTLRQIEVVRQYYLGTPAGTPREVVDSSYGYNLVLHFANAQDQDTYQTHPVHLAFVEKCKQYWTRVQVYDTITE